jgi:Dickkopf-like protein
MSLIPARLTRVLAGGVGPFLGLGLAIIFGSQSLTSCGSDDDASCEPNEEQSCVALGCPNDRGTQTCSASGDGFSACDCAGGSAGSAGAAGSGNAGSSGASGGGGASMVSPDDPRGTVGLPCATAIDCPAGLECIPPSATGPFQNGGPANGYCTAQCATNADCQTFDVLSACALNGGTATPDDTSDDVTYCIALCQTGTPQQTEYKCSLVNGARDDLACLPANNMPSAAREIGLCIPVCHSDAACGTGRFCDLSTGVCVDTAPVGLGIGEACTDGSECAGGTCSNFGPNRFCTGLCTYGAIGGCGFEALNVPEGERGAACLDPAFAQGGGFFDLGICTQLCDVATDCAQADAGWTCEDLAQFGDPTLPQLLGRFGFCSPPPPEDAGAP